MRLKGFIGPAYTLDSMNVEAQRCVNLYPEIIETGTAKGQEIARLKSTPGLINLLEIGQGPIRGVHVDPRGTVFVASGNQVYKMEFSGNAWASTLLGSLSSSTGAVVADSNLSANGDSVTVFVDGVTNYAYTYTGGVEDFDTFSGLGYSGVDTATFVAFIDGYFVFNKPGTNLFYASDWNDLTVDPLSFATAEGDPDNGMALIVNYRELLVLNERSVEFFQNTGNPDFPFERIPGGFVEKGVVAANSVAKLEGLVFWLGRDKFGHGIVYAAQGTNVQRISTHAIENAIQSYDIDSITTADAYTYSDGGHSFYVLNFPDATWVYDLTTKLWHERAYNNLGTLERHRGSYHVFVPALGVHLVGDYENNVVYKFAIGTYEDDGAPLIRLRSSPHISEGMRLAFHKQIQFDIETGVGLDGGVQGSDPQVMLDWSDDGGHTWSSERWKSLGPMGEYKKRVKFDRLGSSRDRIYRMRVSDPVKVNLLGAEIDIELGAS